MSRPDQAESRPHPLARREARTSVGLDRRSLLAGGLALTAMTVLADGRPALAATKAHTFKLGASEITILSDGVFTLPRSFALPDADPAKLDALLQAHGAPAELVAQTNVTLVRTGKTLALIDTGAGTDFMPTLGRLPDALDALGIPGEDITHVVFTHAHADHLWGVIDPFGDGSRWPDARHVMTRAERDYWMTPGVETKVPEVLKGMAIGIQRRMKALGDTLETVKDDHEIVPGLALTPTPGHTPGHASVVIRAGNEEVIVGGDALTHVAVSFAAPSWRWGSDGDWQQAAETRTRLLDRLAASKARLIGYHLPWPGVGHVEAKDQAYRFVPAT